MTQDQVIALIAGGALGWILATIIDKILKPSIKIRIKRNKIRK